MQKSYQLSAISRQPSESKVECRKAEDRNFLTSSFVFIDIPGLFRQFQSRVIEESRVGELTNTPQAVDRLCSGIRLSTS
jgi:GTPase Era involved in 16S rRNA processing